MCETRPTNEGRSQIEVSNNIMIDEYIPIGHLQANTSYEQTFMVQQVEFRKGKKPPHRPYATISFKDVTGWIRGVIFNATPDAASFLKSGSFVRMRANISKKSDNDGDHMEITSDIKNLSPFNGDPDNITDYIQGPNACILEAYEEELTKWIDQIDDPDYRDLVNNAYRKIEILNDIKRSPYKTTGTLAYRGGLLIHIVKLVRKCMAFLENDPDLSQHLNKSLIIAGCIFRNLGYTSTVACRGEGCYENDSFHLLGVQTASTLIAVHAAICAESDFQRPFPQGKKLALENICVADHPSKAHTPESKIVVCMNYLLDIMLGAQEELEHAKLGEDNTTKHYYIGHHKDD